MLRRPLTMRRAALAGAISVLMFALLVGPSAHAAPPLKGKPLLSSSGYSTTPTTNPFGGVILTNVKINGGQITSPVAVGSTVTVSGDFSISQNPGCPNCFFQIQVGLANGAIPQACIFDNVILAGGRSGPFSYAFTAPSKKGTYVLAFDVSADINCFDVLGQVWGNGLPGSNYSRWFGVLTVH